MTASIFVIAEHLEGALTEATFEALAAARRLASGLQGDVVAVLLGSASAPLATQLGAADRVLHVDDARLDSYSPDAYESALRTALDGREWRALLVPNTTVGMDLAAGLAAHVAVPLVAYCVGVRAEGASILATAQIYGGKVLADVSLADRAVLSLVPGSFPAAEGKREPAPAVETVAVADVPTRVRTTGFDHAETADVDITKEQILVSIGRGIGGAENVELAEELAHALGGVVSGSRPVIDSGWLPRSRQVGKSGMTVKPKLYLALGISGAPEHLQGMKDSDLIVAVNSDATAPIFNVAHYGVVGDVLEVIPAMTQRAAQKV